LRRRVFFGRRLTLHQSLSFEVVVQVAQWISPRLPRRAFEAEFIIRETGIERELAQDWLRSRALGLVLTVLLAAAALCWVIGLGLATAAFALGAAAWLLYSCIAYARGKKAGAAGSRIIRHLASSLAGAGIWIVEGVLFLWAVSGLLGYHQALPLYLLSTALVEVAPIPFGLGVAELPALIGAVGGYGTPALGVLIIFHILRLLPLLPLGAVYLARYKLDLNDLQSRDLIRRIAESQRPTGGWSEHLPMAPAGHRPDVSIVVPAYNEERRLPAYLDEVRHYLDRSSRDSEVLVVDDGSTDGTADYVRSVSALDTRVRLLSQPYNQGKGNAVMRGVYDASGRFVLFTDADGATPIAELEKLFAAVGTDAEISIGSRRMASDAATRERAGLRELMGRVFYSVVNFLAVPGVRDTQCGFKLFRADVARSLFEDLNESGWAFDVELLYRAQLYGYRIAEVPVDWHEVGGSKVNPLKDAVKMFVAIFRIRRNNSGMLRRSPTSIPTREAQGSAPALQR
jgi:dolichyl-phosphate beta-glucosyltransferase